MKTFRLGFLLCFFAALLPLEGMAEKSIYVPTLMGTVRARYEYLTRQNKGAFNVRTLRIGLEGYVAPVMSYRAIVDFADWGTIKLIDGYVRLTPLKSLQFTIGQQRMPFSIAAHRLIWQQYFVNRTFLAKQVGSIRDVGLSGGYTIPKIPLTVQASVFNCSGVGETKNFFTKTYGYSAKLISPIHPYWYLSGSTARLKRHHARFQVWDIGGYFDNGLWHVEAEYMRKAYVHGKAKPVNACDFFVYRNFPIERKLIGGISGAVRYDFMSDHSSGTLADDGSLKIDDPQRHRLTLGTTLSFESKVQAYIRLNYEKYFFRKGVVPTSSDDDRIVLEVVAHF